MLYTIDSTNRTIVSIPLFDLIVSSAFADDLIRIWLVRLCHIYICIYKYQMARKNEHTPSYK